MADTPVCAITNDLKESCSLNYYKFEFSLFNKVSKQGVILGQLVVDEVITDLLN